MSRYIRYLLILLTIFGARFCPYAMSWKMYSSYGVTTSMAETKAKVYFLSGTTLYAYDKTNDELTALSNLNILNDVGVTGVFAPMNSNKVAVAYADGNIDIIGDNGTVGNLPDIKDSRQQAKGIRHIAFNDDATAMLVGTDFGAVLYDLPKMEVVASVIFDSPVHKTAFAGSIPALLCDDKLYLFAGSGSFSDTGTWRSFDKYTLSDILGSQGELYAIMGSEDATYPVVLSGLTADEPTVKRIGTTGARGLLAGNSRTPVFLLTETGLCEVGADGMPGRQGLLPQELRNNTVTALEGLGSLWIGTDNGINNVDVESGQPFVTATIQAGDLSVNEVFYLRREPSGNIYIGNRGNSNVYYNHNTDIVATQALRTPGGEFRDITPHGLSSVDGLTHNNVITDPLCMREDPDDPTVFYAGELHKGLYVLSNVDGSELAHYVPANSRLGDYWGVRVMDVAFDPRGYMWLLSERSEVDPKVMVLSPEGRAKGNATTKEDWMNIASSVDLTTGRDGRIEVSADGRYIYAMGDKELYIHDTNGTAGYSDDKGYHVSNFSMADGSGYASFDRFCQILEDPVTHALWVTTTTGVFYIPEPWDVVDGTVKIVKPKVARNDGTMLADYLLSTQWVYGIAADTAGNKWFVTRDSGIFLTNADGTEILANYNTSNSPLPSNRVLSVVTDGTSSGKVFFGTQYGLMELQSEYSHVPSDYNDVKIYPNPVRPDYFGDVTIEGLLPGSRVKILSSGGNLVAEIESEGSTARWSARGANGRRMPSGVYHVLASSQNESGRPVGKIVIVR